MRWYPFYRDPSVALIGLSVAVLGLIVRGIIYFIDQRTEPDIMKRHVNEGSDKYFAREAALGDPMVNQLTGTRDPQYLRDDFEERLKRDLGK